MKMFTLVMVALLMTDYARATTESAPVKAESVKPAEKPVEKEKGGEVPVVTTNSVVVRGNELRYTATAGHLPVLNDAGEADASIFYISYTADKSDAGKQRPLLFFFNGGPGAASVWLHLGAAGPRRVRMLSDGRMPPAPFRLVPNELTWLDHSDLVFVDPVGTGYSRAAKAEQAQKFFTLQGDIDSLGRFIRLYLTRNKRWGSPVFLVGESYGAFRVAGLSEHLIEHGVALNGIVLVSSVMNMQTICFGNGNELPFFLYVPSYAATAWYHKKLPSVWQADLEKTLAAAESWAENTYVVALARGDRLAPEERRAIVTKLAEFTSLDPTFIDQHDLRIDNESFITELLRDRRRIIGTMDSRFTAVSGNADSPHEFDPTIANVRPPYTSMMNDYVRNELGYCSDLEYFVLGGGIGRWDFEQKNGYADTSDELRRTFAKNPYMKLFVASGAFDLATPLFATDYTLNHLGLSPEARKNITTRRYRAGHMMYLDDAERSRLAHDVSEFIQGALPAGR